LSLPRQLESEMSVEPQQSPPEPMRTGLERWNTSAVVAALIILASPLIYLARDQHGPKVPALSGPLFSGTEQCASCHKVEFDAWKRSHHDLAMDKAANSTVLGDFNNVVFADSYNGVSSRFFRQNDKFMVETQGPDGQPGIFEIRYVFGVYPLQQYLVPFPGGRLQCLTVAWDTVKKQWYRLPPYDVKGPDDWLHWTKGAQTWNGMCSECHSTQVRKGFDLQANSYTTNWYAINVGCEACHGPGSEHIKWAKTPALGRPQLKDYGLTVQTASMDNQQQVVLCAPCHSRRFQLGDNDHRQTEMLNVLVPSLLDEGLYFPDGQQQDEVYEFGSFSQSRMYRFGVRCSDCHNVHSLKTHKQGNDLCLQCHRADEYNTSRHHFHKLKVDGKPSEGALCIRCHMPGKSYMGIDFRLDHSLRLPRPDLSASLKVPNACSTAGCHDNKPLQWVIDKYSVWYGVVRKPHYGEVLDAARKHDPDAAPALIRLAEDRMTPAIVRATALSLLGAYPGSGSLVALQKALQDDDALMRYTAIRTLDHPDQNTLQTLIAPKLYDKIKAVRMEAAFRLAALPRESIRIDDREALEKGIEEYRQAQMYNADFAPQRYNLGNLAFMQGKLDEAIPFFQQAIGIDDQFFPAQMNLAMLYSRQGENGQAETLLRQVLSQHPQMYETAYSLGLLLAEMGRLEEAADFLGKAADGMPDFSRARYNQALAYLQLNQWDKGVSTLQQVIFAEPANQEYFITLANIFLRTGQQDKALHLVQEVLGKVPEHAAAKSLQNTLKGRK